MISLVPWEPEESVGKLWHRFASQLDAPPVFEEARITLAAIAPRLGVFFRGLGGSAAVEIKGVADEASNHRLGWKRRLGAASESVARASFDGGALRLPLSLAALPAAEANGALYLWLTAMAAHSGAMVEACDPLHADIMALHAVECMTQATLAEAPGLAKLHTELQAACLLVRKRAGLPPFELALERAIRDRLGDPSPLCAEGTMFAKAIRSGDLSALPLAPSRYQPFQPVPMWLDLRSLSLSAASAVETRTTDGTPEEGNATPKRAKRRKSDQADRRDSLILHRFEAILSWAEFLNLNRRIEDDENDDAKKAADDQDEIGLGQTSKAPATRLKLHLDLAPEDVDREGVSGRFVYPEWDCRTNAYIPAHACVLASRQAAVVGTALPSDAATQRRIKAVRRQFEALRPARQWTSSQLDGEELDMDAAIRAAADLRATGEGNDRIWRQLRPQQRDLAVSILFDASRSTESAVGGRAVIEIAREALTAFAWGIDACGDACAIHAFSSLRRERVFMMTCKDFNEPMGPGVEARIWSLRPGFYTRLGAAIRHASAELALQARKRRLLLVITDGKPNDLDHYEGRHGIEDSAMAVREARRAGHAVFGITIDRDGRSWFPRIFGRGGFALVPHAERLTEILPALYRQLVRA
ncbi:MAG: nitric oxide reductase D protein [Sphingomonadales bacterium]|nr:nitric oxide reductase D protein [Sphingomonadales bacterium]